MKRVLLIEKRKKAKVLQQEGWSMRKIARYLVASKNSVRKWLDMSDEAVLADNRGWKKGRPRRYTKEQKEGVRKTRRDLEKEGSFFIGALVVQKNYNSQNEMKVSKKFVDRTLKEYKLVKTPQKKKKGRSKYMQYPQHTLGKLGKCVMCVDFIGPKYLKGSGGGINFLSCKYVRPSKVGIVERVKGQCTDEVIKVLKDIWRTNPVPDVLRLDNDSAFGANIAYKKTIGRLTLFLLNLGIKPLYIAPRSPWNNGGVEGHNSVFSKKFWNKLRFADENEIDVKINDFNLAYEKYTKLIENNPTPKKVKFIGDFKGVDTENKEVRKFKEHKIRFLRIVRRKGEKGGEDEYAFINVLKQEIKLPVDIINLFVFCVLDLKLKKFFCYTETDDGTLMEIKKTKFEVKNVIY